MASLDVSDQRAFASQTGIADVTEELALDFRLVGDRAGEVGQHASRGTSAITGSSQLSTTQTTQVSSNTAEDTCHLTQV